MITVVRLAFFLSSIFVQFRRAVAESTSIPMQVTGRVSFNGIESSFLDLALIVGMVEQRETGLSWYFLSRSVCLDLHHARWTIWKGQWARKQGHEMLKAHARPSAGDTHLGKMTVGETVDFAAACLNPKEHHSKVAAHLGEDDDGTYAADGAELGVAGAVDGSGGEGGREKEVSFREAVRWVWGYGEWCSLIK
jgi:hypothetical protein